MGASSAIAPGSAEQAATEGSVARFRQLWRQGQQPDLHEFLAQVGKLSDAEMSAILCIDQRHRWQAGERVRAEDYLREEYGLTPETAVDLAYQEFLLREECGETPAAEEYQTRFPQVAEALRMQIELHQALARAKKSERVAAPAAMPTAPTPTPDGWPNFLGYSITGELGRGGMGIVYKARQEGLNRLVALKTIRDSASASREELLRFQGEAEAVAQLQHSHIVQIYDVGEQDGCTYLALEFVDGGSLAEKLKGVPLPSGQAAQIMIQVAQAVHFAHERGIVHRDLKPANILLTADETPKVTDFGLAKRTEEDSSLTGDGGVLGTPSYMPPEQAAGRAQEIGPPADIYSLGATLYFLLTGRPPFQAASAAETLRQVIDQEPVHPRRLNAAVDRDLETICLKCLEKQPGRRYASAKALAEDLGRYLEGRPILARRTSWQEHAWRWVRRNPGWAATLATALGLLLLLAVGGPILSLRLQGALREKTNKLWQSHLDRARAERASGRVGQRFKALEAIQQAAQIAVTKELRDEAAAALVLPDVEIAREWEAYPEGTEALSFDADFDRYARVDKQGELVLCRRTADGEEVILRVATQTQPPISTPLFSADGRYVFLAGMASPTKRKFGVWRIDGQTATVVLDETKGMHEWAVGFRPDSRQIAVGHPEDASIGIYDLETGERKATFGGGYAPTHLAFDPRGERLAAASYKSVRLFDLGSGRELAPLVHKEPLNYLAWHPDGKRLATGAGGAIHVWDVENAREWMAPWKGHARDGITLAFNHAGDLLPSSDWDGSARLWRVATGQLLLTTPFDCRAQISRDDRLLGWGRAGSKVRLFRLADARGLQVLWRRNAEEDEQIFAPVVHEKGRLLAARGGQWLSFFDLRSGEELASWRSPRQDGVTPRGFGTRDGLLTGGQSGLLAWPIVADLARASVLRIGPPRPPVPADGHRTAGASSSLDGSVVAVPQGTFTLVFHRDRSDPPLRLEPQADVRWSFVSPDARWVVTCSHGGDRLCKSARVWEADTGRHVIDLPVDGSTSATFSLDSRWLATVSQGQGLLLFEAGTWREERRSPEVRACAFNPDGKLLAVADTFGVIRLVETHSDREIARLTGPEPMWYRPACFTPDGTKLVATCSSGKAIYVWDLRLLRQELAELGVDWDWPAFPPPTSDDNEPLQVVLDGGPLTAAAKEQRSSN